MNLIKIAKSYLKQAEVRLKDSEEALEEGIYPYALRLSQECVELSLKGILKIVGIEYPKKHDVSDVILATKDRFPDWFKKEIDFLANTSKKLAKKREVSMYGNEEIALSPEEAISKGEAQIAVKDAKKVYELCKKLLEEYISK